MFTEKGGDPPHTHKLDLDGNGTGQTVDMPSDGVRPHTHKVSEWMVKPSEALSEMGDKHVHEIDSQFAPKQIYEGEAPKVEYKDGEKLSAERIKIHIEIEKNGSGAGSSGDSEEVPEDNGPEAEGE